MQIFSMLSLMAISDFIMKDRFFMSFKICSCPFDIRTTLLHLAVVFIPKCRSRKMDSSDCAHQPCHL